MISKIQFSSQKLYQKPILEFFLNKNYNANFTFSLVFTGHIFTLELTEFNLGGGGLFRVEMFIKCCGLLTYYCNLFNFL